MNILITGANGFIGKHLCSFLEENSHKIYKIMRANPENLLNVYEADLTDATFVEKIVKSLKDEKIDIVIHLASKLANTNQTEDEQVQVLIDNIAITKNMVALIKELKPQKLINFSSMAVYPNIDGEFSEDSQIKPSVNTDCMYGLAKFCSENIFDYLLKNQDLLISHLRISQVYGKGMYKNRIMPVMLKELQERNTVTLYGNGERMSDFININKLLMIIKNFIDKDVYGIYNVGDEALSYKQLAEKIIRDYGDNKSLINKIESGSKPRFKLNISKLIRIRNEV